MHSNPWDSVSVTHLGLTGQEQRYNPVLPYLFQSGMRELVDSGRYDTHSNFTVVVQPFFREVMLPLLEVRHTAPPQSTDFFFS